MVIEDPSYPSLSLHRDIRIDTVDTEHPHPLWNIKEESPPSWPDGKVPACGATSQRYPHWSFSTESASNDNSNNQENFKSGQGNYHSSFFKRMQSPLHWRCFYMAIGFLSVSLHSFAML